MPYHYESIIADRQIRLVVLLPGQQDTEIACFLQTEDVTNAPSYETISYVWGNMHDTKPITLQGCLVQISANLEAALRHLRHGANKMILWIDAISINQEDEFEKARQVAMMGRIYRSCERVYIWLGLPGLRGSQATRGTNPFSLIQRFADNRHNPRLPRLRHSRFRKRKVVFSSTSNYQTNWEAFMDACRSPWWSRFWCVQELLLPPESILLFGKWRISWTTLMVVLSKHRRYLISCCLCAASKTPDKYTILEDTLIFDRHHFSNETLASNEDKTFKDLDLALRSYRHKNCKDYRDKVFGILGLINPEKHPDIVTDYSSSVSEVYTNAMISIISQESDSLCFLTGSGFNSQTSPYHIPSWVRDFGQRPDETAMLYEKLRMQAYDLYAASGNGPICQPRIHDRAVLELKGAPVDRISKIGTAFTERSWSHFTRILGEWHSIAGINPAHRLAMVKGDTRQQAFWRTIAADVFYNLEKNGRRMSVQDAKCYLKWAVKTIASLKRLEAPALHARFVVTTLTAIYGRAFFVTEKGSFGLCDPQAKVGDEIWLITGGRVPFVLRPSGTDHTFIGECYLEGSMDGESANIAVKPSQQVHLR